MHILLNLIIDLILFHFNYNERIFTISRPLSGVEYAVGSMHTLESERVTPFNGLLPSVGVWRRVHAHARK